VDLLCRIGERVGDGMGALRSMNPWLAGFFAFAALHYAIKWWFSRSERVLLTFAIQCALYTAFCSVSVALERATTIPDVQAGLVRVMTLGPLVHVVLLQFYASVSAAAIGCFACSSRSRSSPSPS